MFALIDNSRFRKLLQVYPAAAVRILYQLYYKNLFSIALRMVRDKDAADDIVQDAFLAVWANRKKLGDHDRSIEHYLVRIVRNKSVTHYYKHARMQSLDKMLEVGSPVLSTFEISNEPVNGKAEIAQQLRSIISTFPKRERECLLMKIDHKMSVGETAHSLSITPKAVERSITSAYKRLRKWVAANSDF